MNKLKIPTNEFSFTFSRSSGAGGQNINKVNSKASLHWNVLANSSLPPEVLERFIKKYAKRINQDGILTVVVQKNRSQNLNVNEAIKKLTEMIESIALPPKIRKATKPTKASIINRLHQKKSQSDKKKSRQESKC